MIVQVIAIVVIINMVSFFVVIAVALMLFLGIVCGFRIGPIPAGKGNLKGSH